MRFDVEKFIDGLHQYVERALKPIADRIREIESRPPVPGPPGESGASVTADDVLPVLREELKAVVAGIPVPVDGKDGIDGKDGVDGKDGRDGIDGASVTVDDVLPTLREEVKSLVTAIPLPTNGKDGENGRDGADGKDGARGEDGKSVTLDDIRQLIAPEINKWALDFERRAQDLIQREADKFPRPKDGKDGIDGLGFDDLTLDHDGIGNVSIRFIRGEQVKEFSLRVPVFIDKGIFREENSYLKGDGVTCGGSFWISQQDGPEGKPGLSDGWRLAVKRGRDGKDGGWGGGPK